MGRVKMLPKYGFEEATTELNDLIFNDFDYSHSTRDDLLSLLDDLKDALESAYKEKEECEEENA